MFVRVLGGRDGLSHSGKIVVGNRTQWCERNNFAPPLSEGRAGLLVRDRNTLRGSCELMPFWLKPLLCPSSSSFDHRKFKFRCRFPIWIHQGHMSDSLATPNSLVVNEDFQGLLIAFFFLCVAFVTGFICRSCLSCLCRERKAKSPLPQPSFKEFVLPSGRLVSLR